VLQDRPDSLVPDLCLRAEELEHRIDVSGYQNRNRDRGVELRETSEIRVREPCLLRDIRGPFQAAIPEGAAGQILVGAERRARGRTTQRRVTARLQLVPDRDGPEPTGLTIEPVRVGHRPPGVTADSRQHQLEGASPILAELDLAEIIQKSDESSVPSIVFIHFL
jgi:hypothetical protein